MDYILWAAIAIFIFGIFVDITKIIVVNKAIKRLDEARKENMQLSLDIQKALDIDRLVDLIWIELEDRASKMKKG